MRLYVRGAGATITLTTLHPWSTVKDTKDILQDLLKIPGPRQRLVFRGEELKSNNRRLLEWDISEGCTLLLMVLGPKELENPIRSVYSGTEPPGFAALVEQAKQGIAKGLIGKLTIDGTGGTYFLRNAQKQEVLVFKPADEEAFGPNNPRGHTGRMGQQSFRPGVLSGEGHVREIAAYLLDHNGFAGVPETERMEVACRVLGSSSSLASPFQNTKKANVRTKMGSMQAFVNSDGVAADYSESMFPVHEVHKIAILDIRLVNTDRNDANILVVDRRPRGSTNPTKNVFLVPIDHAFCLPDTLEIAWTDWAWLGWPQAKRPVDDATKEYVRNIDIEKDIEMLRSQLFIREPCLRLMRVTHMLLQRAIARGCSLFQIGSMICRKEIEEPSQLEVMCHQATAFSQAIARRQGPSRNINRRGGGVSSPPPASTISLVTSPHSLAVAAASVLALAPEPSPDSSSSSSSSSSSPSSSSSSSPSLSSTASSLLGMPAPSPMSLDVTEEEGETGLSFGSRAARDSPSLSFPPPSPSSWANANMWPQTSRARSTATTAHLSSIDEDEVTDIWNSLPLLPTRRSNSSPASPPPLPPSGVTASLSRTASTPRPLKSKAKKGHSIPRAPSTTTAAAVAAAAKLPPLAPLPRVAASTGAAATTTTSANDATIMATLTAIPPYVAPSSLFSRVSQQMHTPFCPENAPKASSTHSSSSASVFASYGAPPSASFASSSSSSSSSTSASFSFSEDSLDSLCSPRGGKVSISGLSPFSPRASSSMNQIPPFASFPPSMPSLPSSPPSRPFTSFPLPSPKSPLSSSSFSFSSSCPTSPISRPLSPSFISFPVADCLPSAARIPASATPLLFSSSPIEPANPSRHNISFSPEVLASVSFSPRKQSSSSPCSSMASSMSSSPNTSMSSNEHYSATKSPSSTLNDSTPPVSPLDKTIASSPSTASTNSSSSSSSSNNNNNKVSNFKRGLHVNTNTNSENMSSPPLITGSLQGKFNPRSGNLKLLTTSSSPKWKKNNHFSSSSSSSAAAAAMKKTTHQREQEELSSNDVKIKIIGEESSHAQRATKLSTSISGTLRKIGERFENTERIIRETTTVVAKHIACVSDVYPNFLSSDNNSNSDLAIREPWSMLLVNENIDSSSSNTKAKRMCGHATGSASGNTVYEKCLHCVEKLDSLKENNSCETDFLSSGPIPLFAAKRRSGERNERMERLSRSSSSASEKNLSESGEKELSSKEKSASKENNNTVSFVVRKLDYSVIENETLEQDKENSSELNRGGDNNIATVTNIVSSAYKINEHIETNNEQAATVKVDINAVVTEFGIKAPVVRSDSPVLSTSKPVVVPAVELPLPLFSASEPMRDMAPVTKSAAAAGLPLGLDRPLELKRAMSYSFSVNVHPTGFAAGGGKSPTRTLTKSLDNDDWSVPPPSLFASGSSCETGYAISPNAASDELFFSCLAKLIDTVLDFTSTKHGSSN